MSGANWYMLGWLAAFVVSVVLVGLYCGLETSLYVFNKIRLELMAKTGNSRAKYLLKLLHRPNRLLSVLLLGTNIFTYIATFAASAIIMMLGVKEDFVEFYTIAITTPILFAFSDAVPKNVSRKSAQRFAMRFLTLLRVSDVVFMWTGLSPALAFLSGFWVRLLGKKKTQRGSIGTLLEEGQASGAISHMQSVMAVHVMKVGEVHIGSIMQSLGKLQWIRPDITRKRLFELIRNSNYSRLPVRAANGKFEWILDVYDVLTDKTGADPHAFFTRPMYVHASQTVPQTLLEMQKHRKHIAVVVGRKGKHVGIVTIKDLVEEISGEIAEW